MVKLEDTYGRLQRNGEERQEGGREKGREIWSARQRGRKRRQ